MNYFMPARLFTGEGCLTAHAEALAALGEKCLIICERVAAEASGALADLTAALEAAGVTWEVWDGVTANPPVASCIEAGRLAAKTGCAFVVGLGGGSAMDAAKAASVFAANPTLDEAGFYGLAWTCDPVPIVLVGTTAGTGSEVTKVSVLTDSKHRKHSIHDDRLYATLSFGDWHHTLTCPASVTRSCGVDVLAHATEAYFSKKADEISRAFSVRAIRLAWAPLERAAAGDTLSDQDRLDLYEASILGGLAINTCGTCFPHNVGYYLTENFGIPHGFACAVFLPAMLDIVADYDAAYAADFESACGHSLAELADLTRACTGELGVSMDADEIEAALPRWESNGSVMNTRADVTTKDIRHILTSLFC